MNEFFNILLMTPPKGGEEQGNPAGMFIPILLIFVVMYFFMIRPQVKRQKEMKKFRDELKKGDKIVTTGGIYGKILDINNNIITMEVEDKVKMKVDKTAVLRDPSELQAQQK